MPTSATTASILLLVLVSASVQARVFHSDSGDCRIIGIPMEMQSGRGFCAPATMVRVLKYYGIQADQAQLAKQADCTNDTGTDVETMLGIVARTCSDYKLGVETIIGFNYERYLKIIEEYNRLAHQENSPRLWYSGGGSLDLSKTFLKADVGILHRTAKPKDLRRFSETIQKHIDANTPLIWGLVLGIVSEPDMLPNTQGGHLRLIIGYNDKMKQVIYSDPWGPNHAAKRMNLADAYAITMSLHALTPAQAD